MPPGPSTTAADIVLTAWAGTYKWISLHTADPGNTGGFEVGGGGYARQLITWPTAAGGLITWTGTLTFGVPICTVLYFGAWSASTGGTWGDGQLLAAPRPFTAAANCVLTRLVLTAA